MERRIRWKTITERSAWMDNTSQHRSPMKNSFSVETIFLQNIIDLINWTLCTLNLSELPTRARHRHLREQTCFYTWRIQWRGDWSNFEFFFFFLPLSSSSSTTSDQTRSVPRPPTQSNYEIIDQRAHFGPSCLACFVLLAFARFTVNTDITH